MTPRLVLASASPRRRALLGALGLDFTLRPVAVDESLRPGEEPAAYVRRLAREKAAAAARDGELVLAADTVVALAGEIFGKPASAEEARSMLARLSGRAHEVYTGVALRLTGPAAKEAIAVARTTVHFAPLGAAEIDWYLASGEPFDKAGAYAIQGLGALLVDAIEGNYTNVVGLPLATVRQLFAELGFELLAFSRRP
ncbi:MAG: septum formation inhibitor Maf [Acidobacteria bacterium]|jgi:septum formation protein|nr:septum formation inhibitor Maf [Thermoanaerobaculia bacterium]NLN09995.1 septum formation inhibitor Maf [Acidobacteriota bacterium]MBP7812675.1 septum formation inhibitor Maf [Thermoanaerobaculia bacterium]MBP8846471.1 septum formation inhibitor Maf [Thermoanaerobaculia bacterium]HNU83150.1 Maf family protein [Thermoanaerobaculia bacterium]